MSLNLENGGIQILRHGNLYLEINLFNAKEVILRYNEESWTMLVGDLEEEIKKVESRIHEDYGISSDVEEELHQNLTEIKNNVLKESMDWQMKMLLQFHDVYKKQPERSFMQNIVLFFLQEKLYKIANALLHLIKNPKVSEEKTLQSTFYRPLNGLQKIF